MRVCCDGGMRDCKGMKFDILFWLVLFCVFRKSQVLDCSNFYSTTQTRQTRRLEMLDG